MKMFKLVEKKKVKIKSIQKMSSAIMKLERKTKMYLHHKTKKEAKC